MSKVRGLGKFGQPRWLLAARPIDDQEVAGSIPARSGNIFSWKLK